MGRDAWVKGKPSQWGAGQKPLLLKMLETVFFFFFF
jgi:hypothetical protein